MYLHVDDRYSKLGLLYTYIKARWCLNVEPNGTKINADIQNLMGTSRSN